jgi:NADPH-dependent 2,4-dienoyl-CoA reductase/sulfur reductase-like enzyme
MGSTKGLNIDATAAVRKAVDVPVIVVGRMTDPILAESVLEGGKADLVAMGRGLVADPELPNKLKENKFDDIRWCIGCNQGCMGGLIGGIPFTCLVNPAAGREQEMELKPASVSKKILVAGGGPAGMEAARVLALRGHKVTLYEKNDCLGGQFCLASLPPLKQEISQYLMYLQVQLDKTGVKVVQGQALTPDIVADVSPDEVVVATGSKQFIPDIQGIDGDNVVLAHEVLTGKAVTGKKVLVAGGGQVGCETAKFLERYRRQVTIVEMRPEPAFDVGKVPREALMHSLKKTQIKILTSRTIKEITGNGVVVEHEGERETIEGIDTIVLAMGVVSINSLADEIKDMVSKVHVIGDAGNPGNALNAIAAGVEIGRQI